MSALEQYLKAGEAEVTAYILRDSGYYDEICAWPSCDFIWDAHRRLLAWWWANDERPHVFRIDRVTEDDYAVTFWHWDGKIELGPIWNDEQAKIIGAWRKDPLREEVKGWLEWEMEEAAALLPRRP